MSALRKHWLAALVLASATAAAAAGVWLLGTASGARWFLSELSRHTSLSIDAGRVSGYLAGDLRLGSVTVGWPSGEATIDSFRLLWSPSALLRGGVSVDRLAAEGISATLRPQEESAPGEPFELRWPYVSGLPARISARIRSLHVAGLSIRRTGEAPQMVSAIDASIRWQDGVLAVSDLSVRAPGATVTGSLSAGLSRPSLQASLSAALSEGPGSVRRATFSADLRGGKQGTEAAGPVQAVVSLAHRGKVRIAGTITLRKRAAALEEWTLSLPGQPGAATGAVEADFVSGRGRLRIDFHGADFFALAGVHTALSGRVTAQGGPAKFSGKFSLENRGEGLRSARLSGAVAGGGGKATLSDLSGRWMDGTLAGRAELAWSEGFAVNASLTGQGLNPARISPDWPGSINLTFRAALEKRAAQPARGTVEGKLLSSTLRRKALKGSFRAEVAENTIRSGALELHGDGFDISAKGGAREPVSLKADVSSLGGLIPSAAGSLHAAGSVQWRAGDLYGSRFSLRATGSGIARGGVRIGALSLDAGGTFRDHSLRLSVRSKTLDARLAVKGGYEEGSWRGRVTELSAREAATGEWRLVSPVEVTASAQAVSVSPFRAVGPGGGAIEGSADVGLHPSRGDAWAEWRRVDLALLDPWFADAQPSGTASGRVEARWKEGGPEEVSASVALSGRVVRGGKPIEIRHAEAEASWGAKGLSARWDADFAVGGTFTGSASSPEAPHPGIPSALDVQARWNALNLALFSFTVPGAEISGSSSGSFEAHRRKGVPLTISCDAEAVASMEVQGKRLEVTKARIELRGDGNGARGSLSAELGSGGSVTASFRSDRPIEAALPDAATFGARWNSVDLAPFSPWLPEGIGLEGILGGRIDGRLLPGRALSMTGEAGVKGGRIRWKSKEGEIVAVLRAAGARWKWEGERLEGDAQLTLEKYGDARASFRLPVPARLPAAPVRTGPVEGSVTAMFEEKGLLPALFPGMVQESTGRVALSVRAGGTWSAPEIRGSASLSDAGAFLPATGIHVKGVEMHVSFAGQEIRVDTLKVRSGDGTIEGSATVRLDGWRIESFRGTAKGKDFLAVDVPELRLVTSPDLSVEGTTGKVTVRGEVQVPEMMIRGQQTRPPVRPSPDVVIVDAAPTTGEESAVSWDVSIRVVLGKHVLVKTQGIDARLEGTLTVATGESGGVVGKGSVHVAKGAYSTYGVRLDITRGNLYFAGTPLDRPTLDFLALRTVGDVKAGVEVAGTLNQPVVKLYSEPTMPDTDILSYIVLGHPLGQGGAGEQAGPLMLAARALLSTAQSATMQDRLQRRLGIEVNVETKTVETSGAPRTGAQAAGSQETESAVTVGKYLNPQLYIAYGRSIFTGTNELTARYDFWKRWQVESRIGENESGVDLFYKIEFR
ncbi:MAG: translocation/assembly module TamB domain-containing protein [Deltaproteobacteria bacterium]|nr:translocation/assembly module TamB domain-containing protein [Deltaproteobacteria bacterium]